MSAALQSPPETPPAPAIPATYTEALDSGCCPVCATLRHDEFQKLCHWVGANVADANNRQALDAAGGFCNYHFWRLSEVHSPHSGSLLHDFVAERLVAALRRVARPIGDAPAGWLRRAARECPLCVHLRGCETRNLASFAEWLSDLRNRQRCLDSRGLCLPHWLRCERLVADADLRAELEQAFLRQLRHLQTEMREYVRKFDGGQRWEVTPAEAHAWMRAVEKLVGRVNVRPADDAGEFLP